MRRVTCLTALESNNELKPKKAFGPTFLAFIRKIFSKQTYSDEQYCVSLYYSVHKENVFNNLFVATVVIWKVGQRK